MTALTIRQPDPADPWRTHAFDTAEPCPVCGEPLSPGRGWVIRSAGRWVRLRCGECASAFEREPARFVTPLPERPETADRS